MGDIDLFRNAYNLPPNDPQLVLVGSDPGVVTTPGNNFEEEADLDLEWAGAVARNARIIYVYSTNVLTISVPYAINQNLAPIITYSFDECEHALKASTEASTRTLAQQANAQGITWLVSSGDSGAAGCDAHTDPTHTSATQGLAVSFPASLPEVTGVGGTEFNEGTGVYWSASNSTNLDSALSYIPEIAWNATGLSGLRSSGGGLSILYPKPAWQTGPGVPSSNQRAVPDISLASWATEGYRVVSEGQTAIYGGTSAATPSFAGILALVNQYQLAHGLQNQSGQGNINPNLYSLAQNTANVFHDITIGNNIVPCVIASTADCLTGTLGYTAGPGYDLVTGLGSVDGYNLALNLTAQWSTPAIAQVSPSSVIAGGGIFTLSVSGSGFDSGTVVTLTGTPLPTTMLSPTQLLATVNSALISAPGSAAVTVLGSRGMSAPLLLVISPSLGATFNTQRVSTTAPAASGCITPPAVNSFSVTDSVHLYFDAIVTTNDLLTREWVAPSGVVAAQASYSVNSGNFCFTDASIIPNSSALSDLTGIWQVRVLDQGSLLFSIPFAVNIPIVNPFPDAGQAISPSGGSESINLTFPASFLWTASSSANWITLSGATSGSGNGTLNYQVAANAGSARSGTITVAGFPFTVEQQSASIAGLSLIGSMAHLAAEENWTTTFTLVNKTSAAPTARLNFSGDALDPTGNGPLLLPLMFPQLAVVPGSLLAASFDQTLAANASLIVTTEGPQTPPVLVGSAQLKATGAIDGFAIFHQTVTTQEAVVPLETRNASSYLLPFDNTDSLVLGVAVENVSAQNAIIPVVIRDDSGHIISTQRTSISLVGNGHSSFVLSDSTSGFPETANIRGTVEFDTPAGGQISVLGLRFTPPNNALTTIPALANVGIGGGSIAHLASGGDGWKTTFVLINTGTSSAQATLSFFADRTGSPMPLPLTFPQGQIGNSTASSVTQTLGPGATLLIVSTGAPVLLTGSAQLTTTGNVSGFVIFRHNGQEAVVPLESRNANAYIVAFDNTNGTATGVALNAVSTGAVNVPVVVRDDTGAQIATDTITLTANGHYAFTLGTDRYPAALTIRGTIEFDKPAGAQIGALGIRIPDVAAHTYTTLPALAK